MAKLNSKTGNNLVKTHEGATAKRINPELQLRRTVMACMLWENSFYEDGESVADRIAEGIKNVSPEKVAEIAVEARTNMKLRHVPLLIARELSRIKGNRVSELLPKIILRPDELTEFLAIYWKDGRQPLSAQVKKGLAKAFNKFDEYSLAKYNRNADIKLRDVLFLCHAKPKDGEQAEIFKRLVNSTLKTPDTWEVGLSSGKDKKEEWTRLLEEKKLGALALLRNLRNMEQADVDPKLIFEALKETNVERVLPFRFIASANAVPKWENEIGDTMLRCLKYQEKLTGKTAIVVDNSGSMQWNRVSSKSDLTRADAACALAILLREICEDIVVIGFGAKSKIMPPRQGFALRDSIKAGPGGATHTDTALELAEKEGYDRIIVITDEQSHQVIRNPKGKGYVINVASYKNGIGYGSWLHIDGFSESIIDYIREYEKDDEGDLL